MSLAESRQRLPGRQISLKEFARFAFDYEAVLFTLYQHTEETHSRSDLLRIAADHGGVESSASRIVERLIEYRIVEEADLQSGLYRYSQPLVELHRHLAKQGEPVSAESIEANLGALNHAVADIDLARTAGNGAKARLATDDIRRLCAEILRGVVQNHRHIQREALEIKACEGSVPLRVRYERLQHAWDRYIAPLVRMVESRGEFAGRTQDAERALSAADRDGLLPDTEEVRRTRLLLAATGITATRAVTDCVKTVQPVLSELRADSRVVAGAALGMTAFIRFGADRSGLASLLRYIQVREQERFRDDHACDILAGILDFRPALPEPTPSASEAADEESDPNFVPFMQRVIASLREKGEVDDVITFVRGSHPDAPGHHVLRLYHELLGAEDDEFRITVGGRFEYSLPGCDLSSPILALHSPTKHNDS
jgi:hypothetical protein